MSSEEEHCTGQALCLIEQFTVFVIVNDESKVSKIAPEFEIEVSTLDNFSISVSINDRSTSLATLDFIEQVHCEEHVEIHFKEFTDDLDFLGVSRESETVQAELAN